MEAGRARRRVSTNRARSDTTPAARRREGMKRRKNTSRSSHAAAPVKGMPYSSAIPLPRPNEAARPSPR